MLTACQALTRSVTESLLQPSGKRTRINFLCVCSVMDGETEANGNWQPTKSTVRKRCGQSQIISRATILNCLGAFPNQKQNKAHYQGVSS